MAPHPDDLTAEGAHLNTVLNYFSTKVVRDVPLLSGPGYLLFMYLTVPLSITVPLTSDTNVPFL